MNTINIHGQASHTYGTIPAIGQSCPHFALVKSDLSTATDEDFRGKRVVLNIFPSIDTATCAMSVRQFNSRAAGLPNTVVLAISADLPFAAGRFCSTEHIENVVTLSTFRNPMFGRSMGLELVDGPLQGLLARAVVILDEKGTIVYSELVEELTQEPNYKAALDFLAQM